MPKRRGKRKASQPVEVEFNDSSLNIDPKRSLPHTEHYQDDIHVENHPDNLNLEEEPEQTQHNPENGDENGTWQISQQPDSYHKYWAQRYRLFSKYDEGIILDQEGWFSVTPELIATHIAQKIWKSLLAPSPLKSPNKSAVSKYKPQRRLEKNHPGLIMDAFCGPGGNSIQFALNAPPGGLVFAIDIDPNKIYMARHNASVYGVHHRIEFIIGDSLRISPNFRVDAVFLSPPWGGPSYLQAETYDVSSLQPVPGDQMYQHFRNLTPNLALLLPRNTVQSQLISLARPDDSVEIEGNYLSYKLKTITAYYGGLVSQNESPIRYRGSEADITQLSWIYGEEDAEEEDE